MATNYTHNSWGHAVGYWYYQVQESNVNANSNTSTITVNFYVKAAHNNLRSDTYNNYPAGYGSSTPWAKVWINGNLVKTQTPACFDIRYNSSKKIANGTTYLLATASATVSHDSNGGGTCSVKCQHYTSVSPNYVTLESSHNLTKINLITGSSWSIPGGGTHAIGSSYTLYFYPCNNNVSHHVYIKAANTDWVCVAWDKKGTANTWNPITFTIPEQFRSGLGKQESKTLTIRAQSYNGGTYLNHQDANIYGKNDTYDLYFTKLYFVYDLKTEDSMVFYWEAATTHGISSLQYTVSGAHSDSDTLSNNLGTGGNMPAGVMKNPGNVTLRVTLTDYAGHSITKEIYGTIKSNHVLTINSFKSTNSVLYVKQNDVNSGETYVKTAVSWTNSHKITKLEYYLSGANSQYWYQNYPSGTSHSWSSNHLYNAGTNTVKVVIHDEKGSKQESSINITSSVEAWAISCGDSYVDNKLCVNLVNGEFIQNHSRVGVRIKVNHTHDLSYINLVIAGKTYNVKNIDPAASEFTFVCNDYFTTIGNKTIEINVGDVNGRTASETETIYVKPLVVDPPKKPIIEYEDTVSLLLSEGEKVTFTGTSQNLADYKVIYSTVPCNVINASSICDSVTESYLGVNANTLNSKLLSSESNKGNYFVLKDFGVTNSFITRDSTRLNKFHIHPMTPEHKKFYALQWFLNLKPGDSIYIYVIERLQGTFEMLYSDERAYYNIPKTDMFHMCVIPPAPQPLSLYIKEQTDDKIIIEYANPIYNINLGDKDPIHLLDVCLVATDKNKMIINRSDSKKRDGLNGRRWVYYTQRYWHNIYTQNYGNKHGYYTANKYTMEFDISSLPRESSISIVGFYYTDYFNHPSIYSTTNVLTTGKQVLDLELSFLEPKNNEHFTNANPKISAKVEYVTEYSDSTTGYIYAPAYDLAASYSSNAWEQNPIWIKSPVNKDSQVPNFRINSTNEYYFKVKDKKPTNITKAGYALEFYNLHKDVYNNSKLFSIKGSNPKSSGVFIENCLFLKLGDNTIELGDIHTDELMNTSHLIFDWQQERGRFLSIGKNKLELYTCPYKYGKKYIQYNEINGEWLSEGMFISNPIMPYNYFAESIVRPTEETDWSKVEGDIIEIIIPYKLLKPNFSYNLRYSISVDKGFLYDGLHYVNSEQEQNDLICNAYVFSQATSHDNINISGDNDIYTDLIYRPNYKVIDMDYEVEGVNNYNKWINKMITFTTPSEAIMESSKDKNLVIKISTRGTYKTKIKDISLISIDGKHVIDAGRLELDTMTVENKVSIIVNYNVYNFDFGYIDPLDYDDVTQLRDYLVYLADIYEIDLEPQWRPLIRDHSYLKAQDFNDIKIYCQNLFTSLGEKYPETFRGDVVSFTALPYIREGERRGLNTYSSRGKHFFPEWDDLIDAIKNQGK